MLLRFLRDLCIRSCPRHRFASINDRSPASRSICTNTSAVAGYSIRDPSSLHTSQPMYPAVASTGTFALYRNHREG